MRQLSKYIKNVAYPNKRINAFIRGIFEDTNHEVLVLINRNGGPGLSPQGSGEIWMMVPANTAGLVNTDAYQTVLPTPAATPPPGGATVTVQLTVKGDKFDPVNLTAPAGAQVTLIYNDQDPDPHNFALYPSKAASDPIFRSPVITGPVTVPYTFTAPATPGTYYFRSDPNAELIGTFTVTPPVSPAATPTGGGATVPVTLTARNIAFDTTKITVPAGSTVVMTFINNDANIPHNFALYTDSSASKKIFAGDIVTGVKTVTYTFTAPTTPGNYFFRCDVHPEMMTGTFVVT
jgi:plastocyanin